MNNLSNKVATQSSNNEIRQGIEQNDHSNNLMKPKDDKNTLNVPRSGGGGAVAGSGGIAGGSSGAINNEGAKLKMQHPPSAVTSQSGVEEAKEEQPTPKKQKSLKKKSNIQKEKDKLKKQMENHL
mmetsp:Transcript_33566/g.51624  ORF Transcript_33566/g.51624 Transcript_33566/m.51624 type:complete len:125 (-) Transcript_33566:361-735(-)|eukprot:CAMPEP_0170506116 /NCGR_PEP_ID=MMETSP0208-20121228/53693_1 /TAXON_ID=197538 /ORGANISM="Strombidium inclinatum, Strain S3" /LENGTH=124 /DNA_ID=CAMNT_0010787433 /DNA_START=267 /DNA_END=641 /DNA_ORIENTATION=-